MTFLLLILPAATCFCNDDLKRYNLNGWDTKSKECGIPTGDGSTARLYKKGEIGAEESRSYENVKGRNFKISRLDNNAK